MNNENDAFITTQRCRACLISGYGMCHLRDKYNSSDKNIHNLLELLQACASVQATLNDDFPQFLCVTCLQKANDSYQFKLQCINAEMQLCDQLKKEKEFAQFNILKDESLALGPTCGTVEKACKIEEPSEAIENGQNMGTSTKHNIPKKESDSADLLKQRTCDECGKEFKYRASMIKHKRKHNVTSRACTYCSEPFSTAILLARHMEQVHSHLKTIKCAECEKAFFKLANLRLHMNVHSGIKRHMCEVCGMPFALAGNLAAHRRLHTGSKPYTCNQCGRGFTQQAALRSHEAGHSNKKDHVCSDCGAAFSRAGALRNHCKRHLSVRPFVCNLCNKAFTFSSERKRHMTIHTGEKNYECDICGSRFNRSTNLAVHRRIHTGETPHVCTVCGKRFSQAHCLRTHMATHPCALQEIAPSNFKITKSEILELSM